MAVTIAGVLALVFAAVLIFITESQKRRDMAKRPQEEAQRPFERQNNVSTEPKVDHPVVSPGSYVTTSLRRDSNTGRFIDLPISSSVSFAPQREVERESI